MPMRKVVSGLESIHARHYWSPLEGPTTAGTAEGLPVGNSAPSVWPKRPGWLPPG